VEEAEEPTSGGTGGGVKEPDFEAERHPERMRSYDSVGKGIFQQRILGVKGVSG
jgi:hypothetical protein